MLERVRLFALHCSVHLTFYIVPRLLYALFVRLPVTLWELLTFRRPFTFSFRREREIKVVTSATDPAASQQLLDKLGLSRSMTYMDPMYSGHIHTVLGAARIPKRVPYERELFDAPDGNPISLDWLYVPRDRASHTKGILLVVPGLGNYGQTPYIQRLARHCVANDFHCCVLTPRGMGSAPLKVPHLTCATFTKDLRCTLRQRLHKDNLEKRFGFRLPLFLLGYSAGATTSLKFLAEEEGHLLSAYPGGFPVTACVVMSAPYDFTTYAASMALPLAKVLYQPAMLSSLRKYTIKHREVFTNGIPGVSADMESLPRLVRSLKSVQDFEERIVGPHFDYGNAAGYYADGYAPQWVRKIKAIPVVCAAARDDPVTGYGVTVADWQALCNANPNVVYVETPVGGHLGYMAGPLDEYRGASSFLYSFPVLVMASVVR